MKTYVSSRKRSPDLNYGASDQLQNEQLQLDNEIKRLNQLIEDRNEIKKLAYKNKNRCYGKPCEDKKQIVIKKHFNS